MYRLTVILFLIFPFLVFSQKNEVDPNGYNKFYYSNGQLSSEGMMKEGKPDGYWKTYYPNGKLKSEGNRKFFQLDSLWVFYNEEGDTTEKISYYQGKKNGYDWTYRYEVKNSKKTGGPISRELFLQDQKTGMSLYYENGLLKKTVNYLNGRKDGIAKEFDNSGTVITVFEYHNDFLIYREEINRKDPAGMKQGIWKTFYRDDKIRTEATYFNDTLNGYYKEFSPNGKMIKWLRYEKGKETTAQDSAESKVKIVEEFYPGGRVKFRGGYYDTLPVGLQRSFSEDGTVISAKLFSDMGLLEGEGHVDENDQKQGDWKYYFDTGELKSEGKYTNNQRTGEWVFYYTSGKTEQRGSYTKGRPSGSWKWYYEGGQLWREENLERGKEEGEVIEYAQDGSVISKGSYIEGERDGPWEFNIAGEVEKGSYQAGLKEGIWTEYFTNGNIFFTGKYIQGVPEGKHRYYYDTGRIMEDQNYVAGKREGRWRKFDMEGNLYLTIIYKDDVEYKINGKRIDLEK